jgi:hypothetical protein
MKMCVMWNEADRMTKQVGLIFLAFGIMLLSLVHLTTNIFHSYLTYLHLLFYYVVIFFASTITNHWTYQVEESDTSAIRLGPWEFGLLQNQQTYSLNMLQMKHPDYNRCWNCCQFCTHICHLCTKLTFTSWSSSWKVGKTCLWVLVFISSVVWGFDLQTFCTIITHK